MAYHDQLSRDGIARSGRGQLSTPADQVAKGSIVPGQQQQQVEGEEDSGNYGIGGYYGNTYRQEDYTRERSLQNGANAHPNVSRYPGDRRWPDDPEWVWEQEKLSRRGYRSMVQRLEHPHEHPGMRTHSRRRPDSL